MEMHTMYITYVRTLYTEVLLEAREHPPPPLNRHFSLEEWVSWMNKKEEGRIFLGPTRDLAVSRWRESGDSGSSSFLHKNSQQCKHLIFAYVEYMYTQICIHDGHKIGYYF